MEPNNKKQKKYKIQSVQDMIDCTNSDNLENFITDLKGILASAHMLRTHTDLIGKDKSSIEIKEFTWVDDGEHNITINLGAKE